MGKFSFSLYEPYRLAQDSIAEIEKNIIIAPYLILYSYIDKYPLLKKG
ncbi:hypothetical protein [Sulfuricurvum sp.]|nr:hypothetical protein [Sulfuricurvum sp.]